MTIELTTKEAQMIAAFLNEGRDCNGADTPEGLLEDNMTWMSATDLCGVLGWNKQEVGGVMSALSEKGLIHDSGESARNAKDSDWYAADRAITDFWHLSGY
jgi:hypothetical protein